MMIKKKTIAWMLATAFFTACSSTPKQETTEAEAPQWPYTIDLSEVEFSHEPQCLSEFADSIEYIMLSDDVLLPDMFHLRWLLDKDDNIYIEHGNIEKFTPDGKHIKSLLKIGQGPGEIANKLSNVYAAFNLNDNYVYVPDHGKTDFAKFTLNGDYLGKVTKIDSAGHVRKYLSIVNNREIFHYEGITLYDYTKGNTKEEHVNPDGPYLFYVENQLTDSIEYKKANGLYHIKPKVINRGMARDGSWPMLCGYVESDFWLRHYNQDTIYRTKDAVTFDPWYVIKRHPQMADYDFQVRALVADITKTEVTSKHYLGDTWGTDAGVFYRYFVGNDRDKSGFGFCPKNGKAKTYSNKGFKNDLDEYLPPLELSYKVLSGKKGFQKRGYLYVLVDAFKFFEEGAKPPFPDLEEDSNPVLVKLHLKK
ncbi:MAG: hypothetical protein IJX29_10210 [Bacteroides sp.]|nr:hypothetical protein [Bacteroides sp.]MBQ8443716.1 hypothetical protein [Bacteroides sp.]